MMSSKSTPNFTLLNNIKKRAKTLKSQSIKHSEALEIAAKEAGFDNYLQAKKSVLNPADTKLPAYVKKIMTWAQLAKDEESSLYREFPEIPAPEFEYVVETLLNIALKGTGQDSPPEWWRIVAYGLNKEHMKDFGRSLVKDKEDESGHIDVALAYFYRSVAGSF